MTRGRRPSENPRRRNEVPTEHLAPEGEVDVRLTKLRSRDSYSSFTQLWWDVWAASPQSEHFQETDWLRLQMMAPLVEAYFKRPGHYILAELRQNESLLGATVLDRMRLRMGKKDESKNPDELPEDVADFMKYMNAS